ncbi:hypothetical protein ACHHYP_09059 [Achlya hypogyna]|uniref:RING-type domain-containing protein n=1 Tax=Achlya hypogyna TaxID=1202772 RepID=A0A1V9ZJM0_ACHHY|nr:hypothetical protein ACHHYP_09059 [Achlya hypogyna]
MVLPPELQNVLSLVFTCGLAIWSVRLATLLLDLSAMRRAVKKHNVIYLPDIGPGLEILRDMTTSRLQQYLRTQDQVTTFRMAKLSVPFDILPTSLRVTTEDGRVGIAFDFQASSAACSIATYWGVDSADFSEARNKEPAKAKFHVKAAWEAWTRRRQNSDEKAERCALNSLPSSSPTVPAAPASPLPDEEIELNDIPAPVMTSAKGTTYHTKSAPSLFPADASGAYRVHRYTLAPVFSQSTEPVEAAIVFRATIASAHEEDPIVAETIYVHVPPTGAASVTKRLYHSQAGRVHVAHELYGLADFVECSICLEDPTRVIILPCRHCCVCPTCLNEIETCPICRTKFGSYITMDSDTSAALTALLPTSAAIV